MNVHSTSRLLCELLLGSFLCIVTGLILFFFYAFASMVDPAIQGWAKWHKIFGNMFELPFPGLGTALLLAIFAAGFYLVANGLLRLVTGKVGSPTFGPHSFFFLIVVSCGIITLIVVFS